MSLDLGWGYVAIAYFVIVGSSNAVNLTDGLDGLAIGPVMIAGGNVVFRETLNSDPDPLAPTHSLTVNAAGSTVFRNDTPFEPAPHMTAGSPSSARSEIHPRQ